MTTKVILLVAALSGCAGRCVEPPAEETCLPFVGTFEAPALPEGAGCFEAHVSDSRSLVLLIRGAPPCGTSTIGECSLPGCAGVGNVYPGDLIDVWGTPPDPRVVVSFVPQPPEFCN